MQHLFPHKAFFPATHTDTSPDTQWVWFAAKPLPAGGV